MNKEKLLYENSKHALQSDNIIAITNRHLCSRPFMEQLERVCKLHPHAIDSEIAEKPPAPEEIEDDAFFTGEEQEKAEEPEKKGKIPPILKELWSIEDKKQIFKAFGKLLKRLMKGILPGNFFLKATIGTGDPPTTGYLLGLAGILVAKFGNDIQIKGDFTKATVEDIEIRVKGKIVLGRLLWAVLAFGLTKPVRRAIRKEIRYFRGKKADAKGETA